MVASEPVNPCMNEPRNTKYKEISKKKHQEMYYINDLKLGVSVHVYERLSLKLQQCIVLRKTVCVSD